MYPASRRSPAATSPSGTAIETSGGSTIQLPSFGATTGSRPVVGIDGGTAGAVAACAGDSLTTGEMSVTTVIVANSARIATADGRVRRTPARITPLPPRRSDAADAVSQPSGEQQVKPSELQSRGRAGHTFCSVRRGHPPAGNTPACCAPTPELVSAGDAGANRGVGNGWGLPHVLAPARPACAPRHSSGPVGHDPFDVDPERSEVGGGTEHQPCAGSAPLIRQGPRRRRIGSAER